MGEVKVLPGVYRGDLEQGTDVQAVLQAAKDWPLADVVVVGRDLSGEVQLWGSKADADKNIGLLMRGVTFLARAQQVQHKPEPDKGA